MTNSAAGLPHPEPEAPRRAVLASPLLAEVGYLPALLAPLGIMPVMRAGADHVLVHAGEFIDPPIARQIVTFESPIRLPRIGKRRYPPLGLIPVEIEIGKDGGPHAVLARMIDRHPPAPEAGSAIIARLARIWARIDRVLDPDCIGSGDLVVVEPLGMADIARDDLVRRMVEAALAEAGGRNIWLYGPHAGKGTVAREFSRRGHSPRIYPHDNPGFLARAGKVFVLSAMAGLEALIAGGKVTCFATPFYAGRGLTDDRSAQGHAGHPMSLPALIGALLTQCAGHADPVHGHAVTPDEALDRLDIWSGALARHYLGGNTRCIGIPRWKRPMIEAHLLAERLEFSALPFSDSRRADRRARWSYPGGRAASRPDSRMLYIEDGFLRSAGLGSNFHFPLSLAIDHRAMHFDAANGSDLEAILSEAVFSPEECALAARIRGLIVEGALTKYNLATGPKAARHPADGRKIVLIAGQVPDDAAMRYGATGARTAHDLAAAIRARDPEAFIVFKEHPELVAGTRSGRSDRAKLKPYIDAFVTHGNILDEINAADEVHAITSLAGFEALLRGKKVVTWGVPFYAGWGLTTDIAAIPRRTRRLTLDELVAGALIRYPSYVDPEYAIHCSAEDAIRLLVRAARERPVPLSATRLPPWLANAKRFLDLVLRRDRRCYWLGDGRR